jgi:hypothetical protein
VRVEALYKDSQGSGEKTGTFQTNFDATGFAPGCDPNTPPSFDVTKGDALVPPEKEAKHDEKNDKKADRDEKREAKKEAKPVTKPASPPPPKLPPPPAPPPAVAEPAPSSKSQQDFNP